MPEPHGVWSRRTVVAVSRHLAAAGQLKVEGTARYFGLEVGFANDVTPTEEWFEVRNERSQQGSRLLLRCAGVARVLPTSQNRHAPFEMLMVDRT